MPICKCYYHNDNLSNRLCYKQKCCSNNMYDNRCSSLSQPRNPANPNLSLEGQNRKACINKKPFRTKVSDLNMNIDVMSNSEFKAFLSSLISLPVIDSNKLEYTIEPAIITPSHSDFVYPQVPQNPLPVAGRRVLVVGGAKGIGKAIAKYLSENGFNVVASSSTPQAYEPLPPSATYTLSDVPLDVRSEDSVRNFFEKVITQLDILICCAGCHSRDFASDLTGDDLRNILEIKLFGHQRCIQNALRYLRNGTDPRVISVSSILGPEKYILPNDAPYSIANAGLCKLLDTYRIEERLKYASNLINNPISFTVACPQIIETTIGSYIMHKGLRNDMSNPFVRAWQIVLAYLQIGVNATDPIIVAMQMYNILVSPQPSARYMLGDETKIFFGGVPTQQYINDLNAMPVDQAINQMTLAMSNLYNNTTINNMRIELLNIYFPQ